LAETITGGISDINGNICEKNIGKNWGKSLGNGGEEK